MLGEEPPTITVSKGDRINLTLAPLTGGEGAAATKTLQNDLTLSGYFALSGNAAYTARGSASGGSLQGQVIDHNGGTVLSKSYSGAVREKIPLAVVLAGGYAASVEDTITIHANTARIAKEVMG